MTTATAPATGTSPDEGGYKPMPLWLSIPLLLLCLAGGVRIILWYVHTGSLSTETQILGAVPPDGFRRAVDPVPGGKQWRAKTDAAVVQFKADNNVAKFDFAFYEENQRGGRNAGAYPSYIPDATRKGLEGAGVVTRTKQINGTTIDAAVIKKIQEILKEGGTQGIVVGEGDKLKLTSAMQSFLDAKAKGDNEATIAAEIKLLGLVDDVGLGSQEATKNLAETKLSEITKLLTPEQAAALPTLVERGRQPGGGWNGGGRNRTR